MLRRTFASRFIYAGMALTLGSVLAGCGSSTAPEFPPEEEPDDTDPGEGIRSKKKQVDTRTAG